MPLPSNVITQIDFSGGQINKAAKRRDDLPQVATGGLAYQNFRPEAEGTALTRPGRAAVYPGPLRTEFVRMSLANTYHIGFTPGAITITDTFGNAVASNTSASYLWTTDNYALISFALGLFQVCICFPGMQPQVLTWAPDTQTWSFAPFTFAVIGGNVQEPFFRFNALGASMSWSTTTAAYATVGASLALVCSANYFTAAMATNGAVLSILGGQVRITAVADATHATALVLSRLPDTVTFAITNDTGFVIGQVAATTNSGLEIEVIALSSTTVTGPLMSGRIMPTVGGSTADIISSPQASVSTSGFSLFSGTTSTIQWLEEFMSTGNGWPAAVNFGNDRFIFCQFAQRQEAILWTVVGQLANAYIDSLAASTDQSAGVSATSAILEFVDDRPNVLNVVDTGDEFVFTDHGVFFIPLTVSGIALKPGSVQFSRLTNDGCSQLKPTPVLKSVIYANAAGNRISVIKATGSLTLPYAAGDITDVYSDLFAAPITIAVSAGDAEPERLCYVVNADGTLVVGKFSPEVGVIGWHPEPSVGNTLWVTADIAKVWFDTQYVGGTIVEVENGADFLDSTLFFNSPPANLIVGGKGPFWWLANGLITLAENGVDGGDRSIDANGFIIQLQGDVLTDAAQAGGAPISKTWQPVIKHAPPGADNKQRMRRRRIKNALIKVESNVEFNWGDRLVPAYHFGDDGSMAPIFREQSIRTSPLGRSYEPSIALTSTRYGQIRIQEFSAEVTS